MMTDPVNFGTSGEPFFCTGVPFSKEIVTAVPWSLYGVGLVVQGLKPQDGSLTIVGDQRNVGLSDAACHCQQAKGGGKKEISHRMDDF